MEEESGVEAYITKLRKFIEISASRLFQGRNGAQDPTGLIFRILSDEIKLVANKPTSSHRFRDTLNAEQPAVFKNFDFERFCEQIGLDGLEKSTLALSLLESPKSDLQQKGAPILFRRLNFRCRYLSGEFHGRAWNSSRPVPSS